MSATSLWFDEFFNKDNIVMTLQILLKSSGRTLLDLQQLCIIALNTDVVPALTQEGLMPFSNNFTYVIPYSRMTRAQLHALIMYFDSDKNHTRQLFFAQEHNFYYVKTDPTPQHLDEAILLYAAIFLMRQALVTSHVNIQGFNYSCTLDDADLKWLIECTIFKIINSARLQVNTMQRVGELLET
jgi:hypothetical protein